MNQKKQFASQAGPGSSRGHFIQPVLLAVSIIVLMVSIAGLSPFLAPYLDPTPPVLTVWYGPHQYFGYPRLAQKWVNVLGHVEDPITGIDRLEYRLNNNPTTLARLGPDARRLWNPGDFNIEIDPASLHPGDNQLVIKAFNHLGISTQVKVTLTYQNPAGTPILPLPYTIDWSQVQNAQQVLQVVDGKWKWDKNGIRPVEMGYDRMLAIGDARWTNYEVTVPVTVHGWNPAAFQSVEGGLHAGVSIDLRWIGHSDDPRQCPPPHCGWNPVGAFAKFWYHDQGADYLGLKIYENETDFKTLPYKIEVGDTYLFKARVMTTPQGNEYRMKVWKKGSPEPPDWMFTRTALPLDGNRINPGQGAFALVAHQSDVTFGNITVEPVK